MTVEPISKNMKWEDDGRNAIAVLSEGFQDLQWGEGKLRHAPPGVQRSIEVHDKQNLKPKRETLPSFANSAPAVAPSPSGAQSNEKLRILILEDVPHNAELAKNELRRFGIEFFAERVDSELL